jgi:hypothetical protein
MVRLASVLIGLGVLGAAGILFAVGWFAASGEHGYVYWAIRGPLWGLEVVALLLGAGAIRLALRSADD